MRPSADEHLRHRSTFGLHYGSCGGSPFAWFDGAVEARICTEADLEVLRLRWPTFDDVAGSHFDEQRSGSATFLVAWDGDLPTGWGLVQWHGCAGDNAKRVYPDCVVVNHLQVRPERRGFGVGTALLNASEEIVRRAGAEILAISVAVDNPDAGRLYRRQGYAATGVIDVTTYRWFDDDGTPHDEVETSELLIKQLRPRSVSVGEGDLG